MDQGTADAVDCQAGPICRPPLCTFYLVGVR